MATRVLATPLRPPPLVAKMAESLDRLSGGRLILGLGGGSMDEELAAFGLPVPSPRDKVDGMEEAVRIIRGLWSRERLSFDGRRYRTEGARIEPKPGHHIPIWLGTYGNRALAVTGSPDAVAERLLGFLELGFTALNFIPLGPDPAAQAERLAHEVLPRLRAAA